MARKNDNAPELYAYSLTALATAAITGNPAPGTIGGGIFVDLDTDPAYFVASGVGSDPVGTIHTNIQINRPATILGPGKRLVRLGGTVTERDYLETIAGGKAIKATGLRPVVGQALVSGVLNDFVGCLIGKKPTAPIVGADVASAATIVPTGEVFTLTGTATVTAITCTGVTAGKRILIIFASTATVTLSHMVGGTMTGSADDTLELLWDGTTLRETGRSVNA